MGMFGEIAREGMGESIITFLEEKAREHHTSRKVRAVIHEIAVYTLQNVDFPKPELQARVDRLNPSSRTR